jgi:DtxR family transcriptional regulator, Mn-dependent transcriptional regulator
MGAHGSKDTDRDRRSCLTMLNGKPYNMVHVITVSKEDYLKAILEAESEGEPVISATLAHWLKVSPPAVTMAVRRLKKDGLVRVNSEGRVSLTPAGRKIARKLTVRHHLIERMLVEIFGMEWYKVHDEAERLEHAVSPDFESRLLAKLGRGVACPHGNLTELESPASRRRRGLLLLAQAEPGKNFEVSGIYERDRHLLEFLEQRGIRPGAKVHVAHRNYDQTLTLTTGAGRVALGVSAAEKVWVKAANGKSSAKN